jgi:hypothetical protein
METAGNQSTDTLQEGSTIDDIQRRLKEATPDAAAYLDELARSTTDKDIKKAARRALYLLGQKGVAVVRERPAEPQPGTSPASREGLRAWASAYDGAGNRLFLLVLSGADGGSATVAQILANDELGIRDLTLERRRYREIPPLMERLADRIDEGLAVAEIEPDYARTLLARFRDINFRRSTTTPRGYVDLLPRIGTSETEYHESPVYQHIQEDASADFSTAPADLFKQPWFEPWFFAVEEVTQWLQRWLAVESTVVATSEKVKQDRKSAIAMEAASALMPAPVKERYIVRLEESADVLRRRDRMTEARQALFHAAALRAAEDAGEVPFAEAIAARTLEAAAEMVARAESREPSS